MDNHIPAEVFPPGDFIREEIAARGWTQQDLANLLYKPLSAVNRIINGKQAIRPEMAHLLAGAIGNTAQFWLNLEAIWQRQGEKQQREQNDRICR